MIILYIIATGNKRFFLHINKKVKKDKFFIFLLAFHGRICYDSIRDANTNDRERGTLVKDTHKYYIVQDSALPEVLIKCVKAKSYLASGKARTANEASAMANLSRSAFYKYKDLISPFDDRSLGHIITFSMLLIDEPGVLSRILTHFAAFSANVLTINQTIPSGGRAQVAISAETMGMSTDMDNFIELAMKIEGVISFKPQAGQ